MAPAPQDLEHMWLDRGWWWTTNHAGQLTRRLLSWNAGTKNLTLLANNQWETDMVLAVIHTEEDVIRLLDGWEDYSESKNGLAWVAGRLEQYR